MINYTTLGTNQWDRALAFYDALLEPLGATRLMEMDGFVLFGTSMQSANIAVVRPFDGEAATVGNGMMVAMQVESKEAVAAMHEKALALGGSDEGGPGPRGDGFYAAYFRDLDGNKLCVFLFG